jgi:hypothetical protein
MQTPPLLPEEILRRMLRIAHFDGLSVLVLAALFALPSAAARDYVGAGIGVIAAGAGAIELHGETLLRAGWTRGMAWLVGSQFFLMAAMLGYCALRLTHVVLPPLPPDVDDMIGLTAQKLGLTKEQYLRMVYRFGFQVVAALSVIYQGGMALYYLQRRAAVAEALAHAGENEADNL